MTYHFSTSEKAEMWRLFNEGMFLKELGQKFECSYSTIGRIFNSEYSKEYLKIVKKHLQEVSQKNIIKHNKSEKGRKIASRNGQKTGPENIKKAWELPRISKNHWNWKGGISSLEFEKSHGMTSQEWQTLAQLIRKRDRFICQYCGKKRSTSVHHIIPRRVKIDNHPDNLIALCKSCHVKVEKLTDKCLKKKKT